MADEEIDDLREGMTITEFHTFIEVDMSLTCHGVLTDDDIYSTSRQSNDAEDQHESDE